MVKNLFLLYLRVTYKDNPNQAVLSRLVREVKALNPAFLTQHKRFADSNICIFVSTYGGCVIQMLHIDFIGHVVRRNQLGEEEHLKKRIRLNESMRG